MLPGSNANGIRLRLTSSGEPWNMPQSTRIRRSATVTRNCEPVTVPTAPRNWIWIPMAGRSMADGAAYHRTLMVFPISPPIEPMLAKPTPELPVGDGWRYEPKWDGFRALVFRDGPEVYLQSRDLKPLDRYFPELLEPIRAVASPDARFVLDGEIV